MCFVRFLSVSCFIIIGNALGHWNFICYFSLRILKNDVGRWLLFIHVITFTKHTKQEVFKLWRRSGDLKKVLVVPTKTFPVLYMTIQQYLTWLRGVIGSIATFSWYKHSISFNNADIHVLWCKCKLQDIQVVTRNSKLSFIGPTIIQLLSFPLNYILHCMIHSWSCIYNS